MPELKCHKVSPDVFLGEPVINPKASSKDLDNADLFFKYFEFICSKCGGFMYWGIEKKKTQRKARKMHKCKQQFII